MREEDGRENPLAEEDTGEAAGTKSGSFQCQLWHAAVKGCLNTLQRAGHAPDQEIGDSFHNGRKGTVRGGSGQSGEVIMLPADSTVAAGCHRLRRKEREGGVGNGNG